MMDDPDWKRNETERKVSQALEKVAQEVGAKSIAAGEPLLTVILIDGDSDRFVCV